MECPCLQRAVSVEEYFINHRNLHFTQVALALKTSSCGETKKLKPSCPKLVLKPVQRLMSFNSNSQNPREASSPTSSHYGRFRFECMLSFRLFFGSVQPLSYMLNNCPDICWTAAYPTLDGHRCASAKLLYPICRAESGENALKTTRECFLVTSLW